MSDGFISPGQWEPWSARVELMPKCECNEPFWTAASTGEPSCHGGWDMHWHHVRPGAWYQVDVGARTFGVPHVHDNVHAELIWWDKKGKRADWAHVRFGPAEKGVLEFAHHQQAPADAVQATLRLMLRWTDRGKVVWCDPRIDEIPASEPRNPTRFPVAGDRANVDCVAT